MEQIIKKHQEEIKLLTTDINRIDKTLHYQEMISSTQVIPTKYLPKCQPETEDMSLQNRFNPQYKKLFFEHLKSVISYNTTSITIKRALLHTEIRTIENILINFTETPKTTTRPVSEFHSRSKHSTRLQTKPSHPVQIIQPISIHINHDKYYISHQNKE